MSVTLKVKLQRPLPALTNAVKQAVADAVGKTAVAVETRAKAAIETGPKTGRVYTLPGGREHRASAPGEAPASQFGQLVNSILTDHSTGALEAEVRVGSEHGLYLELGSVKAAPRPFLTPALEGQAEELPKRIYREVDKVIG